MVQGAGRGTAKLVQKRMRPAGTEHARRRVFLALPTSPGRAPSCTPASLPGSLLGQDRVEQGHCHGQRATRAGTLNTHTKLPCTIKQ